ncbi:phage tail sheath subtilisin-like domain-containing protein [Pseudoxanthomonas sp. 22568]|uniref:phage tail sheath subtilisin-like domain-containing protein n=1 Tax=Pseudoxanthomonas sp. 22568 TaxID=3453945 RepID=UPI003F85E8CB
MISFNLIPLNLRTPGQYLEFDNSQASRGLPIVQHKMLIIGMRLAVGVVAANVPTPILSTAAAEEAFGRGSQAAAMVAAVKAVNRRLDLTVIALDDLEAGVAATGTITVANAPTASGVLALYVAGTRIQVGVAAGATTASIATAIGAAINAVTQLPVTAAVVGSAVTLTARHKGVIGNSIDVRHSYNVGESLPTGLGLTIAAMGGGAGNPDITAAIAAMADEQYHTIALGFTDATNLAAMEAELARRWGPMAQKEGHAFVGATGTHAALVTLGDSRNSPHLTIMGAGKSPSPPWLWAATTAAVDATETDPARPRQTLALPGLLPAAIADRFDEAERNLLLFDGISTHTLDAGGMVRVERLITTYQEDATGNPDESYLNIETVRTLAYIRLAIRTRIAQRFPRHKLANDGTAFAPGQAVATPSLIRGELIHLFRELEAEGLVENFDQFKADLVVERNAADRDRVDALIPPDLVNQLRTFAGLIQFIK